MENNYIFWDGSNSDYSVESDLWGNVLEVENYDSIKKILGYEQNEYKKLNQIKLVHPEALTKLIKDMQIIFSSIKSGKYYGVLPVKNSDDNYLNIQFIAEYDINKNIITTTCRQLDESICSIIYPIKSRKTRSDKGKLRKRNENDLE